MWQNIERKRVGKRVDSYWWAEPSELTQWFELSVSVEKSAMEIKHKSIYSLILIHFSVKPIIRHSKCTSLSESPHVPLLYLVEIWKGIRRVPEFPDVSNRMRLIGSCDQVTPLMKASDASLLDTNWLFLTKKTQKTKTKKGANCEGSEKRNDWKVKSCEDLFFFSPPGPSGSSSLLMVSAELSELC